MYGLLNVLTWVSRGNTFYSYTQARNLNDVLNTTVQCIVTECLLYQAKNMIRSQRYRW